MKQSTSCPSVLDGQGVESLDPVRVAGLERMTRVRDSLENNVDNDGSIDSDVAEFGCPPQVCSATKVAGKLAACESGAGNVTNATTPPVRCSSPSLAAENDSENLVVKTTLASFAAVLLGETDSGGCGGSCLGQGSGQARVLR